MSKKDGGPDPRLDGGVGVNGSSPFSGGGAGFDSPPPTSTNGAPGNAGIPGFAGARAQHSAANSGSPLDTGLSRLGTSGNKQPDYSANSNTMEYFRRIYLSLQSSNNPDVLPTIGVTSATDGEGKSTIALGIASAMASDLDSPIVLVELNLARPSIYKSMGIPPQPGLSEYLRAECSLPDALRQITENFFVLPAGDCRNDPARLIRLLTRANLLPRLYNSGAMLVLDLPSVLTASYGVLASSMADAVVMVVRAGQTPEKMVKDAIGRLEESTLRGIILNAARPTLPSWLGGYI
ncbi:MAG TPA: CpsD/CapB family tyrosine-protein kinase [Ktedonobacterales bacterium]|jgi:Mrp family chromosome partitioning ATPase